MSEIPLEDCPDLADLAHQAATGGEVVYLTEHGRRLAAMLPAEAYEDYKRLQEAEIARAVRKNLGDDAPRLTFTSIEDMARAAGLG